MKCEFCGKEKDQDELESTTIVGWYCADCHRLVIEESRDAIRKIKANKRLKPTAKNAAA